MAQRSDFCKRALSRAAKPAKRKRRWHGAKRHDGEDYIAAPEREAAFLPPSSCSLRLSANMHVLHEMHDFIALHDLHDLHVLHDLHEMHDVHALHDTPKAVIMQNMHALKTMQTMHFMHLAECTRQMQIVPPGTAYKTPQGARP